MTCHLISPVRREKMKLKVILLSIYLTLVASREFELESFTPSPNTDPNLIDYGTVRVKKIKRNQFALSGDFELKKNIVNEKTILFEIFMPNGDLLIRNKYPVCEYQKELEKKKKKDAKVAASSSQGAQQPQPQVQTKPQITATQSAPPKATNGKAPAQKTESSAKHSEPKLPQVNGKASLPVEPSIPASALPTSSPASVIKRSSDHSINSIISASPSPPAVKTPDIKPRVIDLEKLANPSDLLKGIPPKTSLPRFSNSPIDITSPEKVANARRSDSSDSDCVEIVSSDFNPIRPEKSLYHNNNNKVNHQTSHPAPIAKKLKKHGSDDGEQETDYSKIIMGLQSLTDKTNQFLTKNPLSSPVSSARKAETSHVNYEKNGSDHFLDPKLPAKSFTHNSNHHYSFGEPLNIDRSLIQGKSKSSDHHKSSQHYYNHQQQLTSSTNNNLHSISLSLTTPARRSPNHDGHSSTNSGYLMPSILNLSNRK